MFTTKTFFYGALVLVGSLFCYAPVPLHAQTSWKTLRQQGANFYAIEDTFLQQNALLLQQFQDDLPRHEGYRSGKFNAIIKFNRWANYVRPRMVENGGNLNAITTGNARALTTRSNEFQSRVVASWQLLSPNRTPNQGGNGRINSIRVHPTQPNTVFACSPAGGLWRTQDGGTLWTNVTDAIGILGCSDVVFAPDDPNTLYLATGDADASSSYSTGVFKSTNGGTTWMPTGLTYTAGQTVVLSRLLAHPTDGSLLVAGSNGIHRSTNGGQSWQQVSTANTREMTFSANNPSIVFASLYTPALGNSILLRSADGGLSWNPISNGLPTSNQERAAIAVTPANPNYVYLLIAEAANHGLKGLYRSTDAGLSFANLNVGVNLLGWEASGLDSGGQGWYDLALAASPTNANIVVTGGVNIWKSVNGGQSFNIAAHWSGDNGTPKVHSDIHHLLFDGNTIWAACDGGVFKSPDAGATWQDKSQSLAISQLYDFGSSPTDPNRILMGLQDNGTNLMTQPEQWSEVLGGDGMQCFFDKANPNTAFASIYAGSLYRSSDGGQRFSPIYTLPNGNWVTPWLQDPVQPNTLYAGAKQLFKSTNSGTQWAQISQFASNAPINAIEVAHSNPQIIYVSKGVYPTQRTPYTPILYKTTNGGVTWSTLSLTNFPANAPIVALHLDANNPQIIYVGLASYSGASVYRSTDGGTTWVNYSTGLPQVPANCFVTTHGHADGEIFVGTDIGVYRRGNSLNHWESFSQQLPAVPVSKLEIFYPTAQLRAGTYGRGLWESLLPGYNAPPIVQLTAPTDGHVFTTGTPIVFTATARDVDGNIKRVQFYRQGALVATDSVAPYEFQWTNAPIGTYQVYARATDDSLATAHTPVITISVVSRHDGALVGVPTPNGLVLADTVSPVLQLKNIGAQPLTSLTIDYQLDNQAIQTFQWAGLLAPQTNTTLQLPILRYAIGRHEFKAYITHANQVVDENHSNDTIQTRFSYYQFNECADNFEPNNTFATAIPIPLNTTVRSKLAQNGDEDYFVFKTSVSKPNFKIHLKDLPADFDFEVYQYNAQRQTIDLLGIAAQPSLNAEMFEWTSSLDSCTYYVRVYHHFNQDSCYTLFIESQGVPQYDASLENISPPQFNARGSRAGFVLNVVTRLGVLVKNKGTLPIHAVKLAIAEVGSLMTPREFTASFPIPLMPNDTIRLFYDVWEDLESGTSIRYRFYLKQEPPRTDINRLNDTLSGSFTIPDKVQAVWLRPFPYVTPIYRFTDTILLRVSAMTTRPNIITKVEFYDKGQLFLTDSLDPYEYRWINAPLGKHSLTAKAYNNAGSWVYTNPQPATITVASALDAGVVRVMNERAFRVYDSINPVLRVRNEGATVLNTLTCSYQLDNQPIVNQTFTNLQLAMGDSQTVTLPFLRLNNGRHRFKAWVHRPNNGNDMDAANDTTRFEFEYKLDDFTQCYRDFGSNQGWGEAAPIPVNQEVRCHVSRNGWQYYQFKTSAQYPHFSVQLDEMPFNLDLYVYEVDSVRGEIRIVRSSTNVGVMPDSLFESILYTPRTFLIQVEPKEVLPETHSGYCYRLRVKLHEHPYSGPTSGDLGIDSILIPPVVNQTWINFGLRLRNHDTLPIPANRSLFYNVQLNNGFPGAYYLTLRHPLPPQGTIIAPIAMGVLPGSHQITAYISSQNGLLNRNASNDTARVRFRHIEPTVVMLNAPSDNVLIPFGNPIPLNVSATSDAAVRISSISLYRDSILLGSILGNLGTFAWQNAPKGMHVLRAQSVDNQGSRMFSNVVRIYVTQNADAGIVGVSSIYGFWVGDTNTPQVQIRNFGQNPLTQVRVHSQLDNGIENVSNLTGIQLASNGILTVPLGLFQYPVGAHVLKVWTSLPNGIVDSTPRNDTFRYTFDNYSRQVCQPFGIPNTSLAQATPILTDTDIRGRSTADKISDWYLFKTTRQRPQWRFYLDETPLYHYLRMYKYNAQTQNWQGIGETGGYDSLRLHHSTSLDSSTYAFELLRQDTNTSCYRIRIVTSDRIRSDVGIDSIQLSSTEITNNWMSWRLFWRNQGERDVDTLKAAVYVDDQWVRTYSLGAALTNRSYSGLIELTGYNYGSHRVRVQLQSGVNVQDVNSLNDTFSFGFRYVSVPQVRLTAPAQVRQGDTAMLEAIATDDSGITQVAFYKEDSLLGTVTTAPYRYRWENIPIGTHRLTARAYNRWQKMQQSQLVEIQSIANLPPQIQWTAASGVYRNQTPIQLTASASDADGQIVAVRFYKDTTLLGADYLAPYEFQWANAPVGVHRLTARVVDNEGAFQTDTTLTVTVQGRYDAGMAFLQNGSNFANTISSDTFIVDADFKNYGSEQVPVGKVSYQLDQQPVQHYNMHRLLQSGETRRYSFPTAALSRERQHIIKAWTTLADSLSDENPSNDTLLYHFGYQECGDNYSFRPSVVIRDRQYVYSTLNDWQDKDFYIIRTTDQKPYIRLWVYHPTMMVRLKLSTTINGQYQLLTGINMQNQIAVFNWEHWIEWRDMPTGRDYSLEISAANSGYDAVNCYSLYLENDTAIGVGVSSLLASPFGFRLMPNPAQTQCQIVLQSDSDAASAIWVTDLLGRRVWQQPLNHHPANTPITISTEDWVKGIYLVTLRQGEQLITRKLKIE